jgi:hypothetical protein
VSDLDSVALERIISAAPTGSGRGTAQVILYLFKNGASTTSGISKALDLRPVTVNHVLRNLIAKGVVFASRTSPSHYAIKPNLDLKDVIEAVLPWMIREDKDEKQKLTLGISKDVIEKAKLTGINISAITEQVLKAITFEPSGTTKEDITRAYEALFQTALPVIRKYGAEVRVGREPVLIDDAGEISFLFIKLDPSNEFSMLWKESGEDSFVATSVEKELDYLDPPTKILENLILALTSAAEENKETLKELEIAMRFVRALAGNAQEETKK